jgi:hypothetical protein
MEMRSEGLDGSGRKSPHVRPGPHRGKSDFHELGQKRLRCGLSFLLSGVLKVQGGLHDRYGDDSERGVGFFWPLLPPLP